MHSGASDGFYAYNYAYKVASIRCTLVPYTRQRRRPDPLRQQVASIRCTPVPYTRDGFYAYNCAYKVASIRCTLVPYTPRSRTTSPDATRCIYSMHSGAVHTPPRARSDMLSAPVLHLLDALWC